MNHAVAQRLTRFAEDTARVERKVDEILALLHPLTTPAGFITTPGGGRIPVDPGFVEQAPATDDDRAGARRALHAYGHIINPDDTVEQAVRRAFDAERARRDGWFDDAHRFLEERDAARRQRDAALAALPHGSHFSGNLLVVAAPMPERRRWWGRRRR